MGYILYSALFVFLTISTLVYLTRARWLPLLLDLPATLPPRFSAYFYTPLPSSFAGDIESGLTSADFDLSTNLSAGDSRAGLDDAAKREIRSIMKGGWFRSPMGFDEARRVYMERMLEREGIGRDGRPRDPKFVSFS